MKTGALAICFVLLVVGGRVKSQRHGRSDRRRSYKLLVFGDSFVEAGNLPRSEKSLRSRGWYYPSGSSDSAHDKRATGRLSNGLVQSDFVAKILGLDEPPPAYRRIVDPKDDVDSSGGVNFAVGGTGVLEGSPALLGQQIDQLRSLVKSGAIDLDGDSVALVSTSAGRDYERITGTSSFDDMMALSRTVTDEIKEVVRRLQNVGVSKVLVNSLPPMGCTPWGSFHNNHTHCDSRGNMMADVHNAALRQKLAELASGDDVLLLDLNSIFKDLLVQDDAGSSGQFGDNKLTACCDTSQRGGYCGQDDAMGRARYSLCDDPDHFFIWDYMHPTQAAWKAVMKLLQDPIMDFLAIDEY